MSNDFALSIRSALIAFLAPLREAAADPAVMVRWLASLGHKPGVSGDPALLQIAQAVEAIAHQIETLSEDSLDSWDGISGLLDDGRRVSDVMAQLRQFAHDPGRSQVAADLAEELSALMLATYLRRRHATAFRVGAALDLIRPRETAVLDDPIVQDVVTLRYPRVLDRFNSASISQLLTDPGATLSAVYFPNGMALAADALTASQRLFPHLSLLADELGLSWGVAQLPIVPPVPPPPPSDTGPVDAQQATFDLPPGDDPGSPPPDPLPPAFYSSFYPTFRVILAQSGSSAFALEVRASSAQHDGAVPGYVLALTGSLNGAVTQSLWQLSISAQGQIPAVSITPTGVDLMPGGLLVAGGETHVMLQRVLPAGAPPGPVVVLGNPQGTRLALGLVSVDVGVHYDPTRKALSSSFGAGKSALVIASSDGDGFLAEIVPADGLRADFDLGLAWSSDTGLTLRGSADLEATVPVGLSVAGVSLTSVHLGLRAKDGKVEAEVSASVSAAIGPVRALLDRVGITGAVTFPATGGNLGVADLDLGFKGPSGIGLSIDAQGVLTGGGFLFHDEAQGLYAGAMQLSLHEAITLKAFGLIATRLPDGRRGYSLIVFITAEDFRPIPLGLGFTLLGIGGMVGVHRTFDQEVLREGLKSGLLATLLFPPDPVGNAPALIRSLASAFPARRGSYLLGLLVEIGWFTPTLVHLDLALILEFGARTRLLALGRISALLPSADNDLVRLNMEAMGVLDFDASTAAVDAVLVDSRLAEKFVITGAAALRAGFGTGPSFVLAVGGFNPHFAPPAGVPALERVGIALSSGDNPRLLCEAYFAITSNTLQFGARASLYAGAGSFSVSGDVGFDVLVQIAPLHFIAEFHAQFQLKCGGSTLFMVSLAGALQGPRPLVVSGQATFEIFWCDFSVQFNTTLVDGEPPPDPLAVDVLTQLTQALLAPASWRTERRATETHGVALRSQPPASATAPLVLDPLGQLLVMQQVVPLNTARDIDTFGGAPVAGARHFALTAAFTATATSPLALVPRQAAFAPAQFFVMSEDDQLAAPSFEAMDAGGVFGEAPLVCDPGQVVPAPVEYVSVPITLSGPRPPDQVTPAPYALTAAQLQAATRSGAAARAPVRGVGRARFRNESVEGAARLTPPRWTIVSTGNDPAAPVDPAVRTWSDYQGVLHALNRGGARWQLVPAHELDG